MSTPASGPDPADLDPVHAAPGPDNQIAGDQAALWNGAAGQAWVDAQAILDRMFASFEPMLVDACVAAGGGRVLDVGCGTGAVTLAVARALGAEGRCTGVDVSAPMIALARQRAAEAGSTAEFLAADAARCPFAPATFDAIVSRFGVMFFDDAVAAFAHLRAAARPGATLRCVVWRDAAENPFMTTAERAAAPLLPGLAPRRADGPGQFAFADPAHVRTVLAQGGWRDIAIAPVDVACTFAASALPMYVARMGPVARCLETLADAALRERVAAVVEAAFAPFVQGDVVRFDAACWRVEARAP